MRMAWLHALDPKFALLTRSPPRRSHQDQITELPAGARLLASSKLTPNEIWAIGNQVLGIQGEQCRAFH